MNDGQLLRAYALEGSEAAFTELVNRYLGLVHSVARRHLIDDSLAADATQAVFVLLSRRAPSLTGHPSLAGWLHRTAWQIAARTARTEQRRRRWETEACANLSPVPPMPDLPESTPLGPVLDEALQELAAPDRDAIVLRYFLRKPLREVGTALGTTEAAAKMRVRRALEQLRTLLIRRGITCSPAALAAAIAEQGVAPVPAALAVRIISAATSAGSAALSIPLWAHPLLALMNATKATVLITAAVLIGTASWVALRTPPSPDDADPTAAARQKASPANPAATRDRQPVRSVAAAGSLDADKLEAARRRLRLALATPLPKSGISWPEPAVLEAIAAFGGRHDEVFAALKEAVQQRSPDGDSQGLIPERAISAMGTLDKSVPGLTAYLWNVTEKSQWGESVTAFTSLRQLGLESSDLPALSRLLQSSTGTGSSPAFQRLVPQAIRSIIRQDPDGAVPHLQGLVQILAQSDDPKLRFSAAAALAGSPFGNDPRVLESIQTRMREGLNVSGTDRRAADVSMALEVAAAAGPAAAPLIPDLLVVARTSHHAYERDAAWQAIDAIQPSLRKELPDLDQAVTQAAETRRLREDLSQGSGTPQDLIQALRDPALAVRAATALGDAGIQSPEVIPAMLAALPGMDEPSRDAVVKAIQQLDPQQQIERVPSDVMFHGVIFARSAFDRQPATEQDPRVDQVILDQEMFSTWRTPDEILGVVKKLAALDPRTARAFVDGIAEKDSRLGDHARRLLAAPSTP